jgi:hypothetical protein
MRGVDCFVQQNIKRVDRQRKHNERLNLMIEKNEPILINREGD